MTNWTWANEPRPGRLVASWQNENILVFQDNETGETVDVMFLSDGYDLIFNGIPTTAGQHFVKGEGLTERDVFHVITRGHCQALRAGLTVHRSVYSSTPHEFEKSPVEGFEEVFLFLLPDGGKAILEGEGLWPSGAKVDKAWPVRDRQLCQVPMGRHRVAAMPGDEGRVVRVSYVWAYLALEGRGWEKD